MTDRLSFSPKEASEATGVALTTLRAAITAGDIEVRYPTPKRQVITREALERWLSSLPTERSGAA